MFVVSGFAGLIYESVWTHYLKLYLGHAAYAQSLVLIVFMGGMALGAGSARAPRMRNPLRAYAVVEAAIGVFALVFHPFSSRAPNGPTPPCCPRLARSLALAAKWALSALILPQSVLLGATFPLMSAAWCARPRPGRTSPCSTSPTAWARPGRAGAGSSSSRGRLAGHAAHRRHHQPGLAGSRSCCAPARAAAAGARGRPPEATPPRAALLAVALLTGLASFIYEICWIRMLSLVLGASTHSFELMLSTFILGLALGGLAVRRLVDRAASPERLLGWVQVAMALAALATLPVYDRSFELMEYLMKGLARTDAGYLFFNLAGQGISALVMLPATFSPA